VAGKTQAAGLNSIGCSRHSPGASKSNASYGLPIDAPSRVTVKIFLDQQRSGGWLEQECRDERNKEWDFSSFHCLSFFRDG
jgi:hypothetical protein